MMTDVVGSTRLWAEHPIGMNAAMARHHEIIHGVVAAHGGRLPADQGEGDAVFVVFESAASAVAAVVAFHQQLAIEPWPSGVEIRLRVGLHAGDVIHRDGNVFGSTVNRCARIRGLGSGGQVLLSAAVFEMVRDQLPEGVEALDLGEHRMRDLTRPEHVHQLQLSGSAAPFPRSSTLDPSRHNLPLPASNVDARNREIAEVVRLIERERLITIVGFGGAGKTRLALQVAAELAGGAADMDEVWFIDLSTVGDTDDVPEAIGTTLGIGWDGDGVLPGLLTRIRARRLVLVLDHLEQLLPDVATLVSRILQAAPRVRVLATSREPLRVRGEQTHLAFSIYAPSL